MTNEVRIKSECLLQQLENWKLIAAAYGDLIEKDAFLKEFLAFKVDIAGGFIEELQGWEEVGNETKCKDAIDNAEFFLRQIQALFDRVFAGRYQEKWREMEEEYVSTDYILVPNLTSHFVHLVVSSSNSSSVTKRIPVNTQFSL